MAENTTSNKTYKINFNGTDMTLNDGDLRTIEQLLLSKHSGLNEKRKTAYQELLNSYTKKIRDGESFDLSSYNYGDSNLLFKKQRDNAVKYDLLKYLGDKAKQQSSTSKQDELDDQNLAQYNLLTNGLNGIVFHNNDTPENVTSNLNLIKGQLNKIQGLDPNAINNITDAKSFIEFINANRDILKEDPENIDDLVEHLTFRDPNTDPNKGKKQFGNTNIYYDPSKGESVKLLVNPENKVRYLYQKDDNGTLKSYILNDKGEQLSGEGNTIFGHYLDPNGNVKIVMQHQTKGLGSYDYDKNDPIMSAYNRGFDHITRSSYEYGTQQKFNFILDEISKLSNVINGTNLPYADITGLIDGFQNSKKHVFLTGEQPLHFGEISERDAYIYDEETQQYLPIRISTKDNLFTIKYNNGNQSTHGRNFSNNYDPEKFLQRFDFGIDATALNNFDNQYNQIRTKIQKAGNPYNTNVAQKIIEAFKGLTDIDLNQDITDEKQRKQIAYLYVALKEISKNSGMQFEDVIRNTFKDKNSEYVAKLIQRMSQIITSIKDSNTGYSNNSSSTQSAFQPVDNSLGSHSSIMKYGGILKYALGAEITKQLAPATIRQDKLPTEEELQQLEQEYLDMISPKQKRKNQEGYLPINGNGTMEHQWNAHDTADLVAGGMDLASLVGGLPGIILSGAALVTDLINQGTDDRYSKGDVFKNVAINLGFMLLSAIPGAASAKFAKNAQKAHKQLKTVEKFIRNSETGKKLLEKAGPEAVNKLIKATEESLQSKELKSLWLEKMASKGERAINAGGAAIGLYAGYEGVKSAAEDIREHRGVSTTSVRQMVGGLAGGLSLGRGVERLAIRRVTEPVTGVPATTSIGNSIDVGINKSKLNDEQLEFIKFKKGDQQFFDEDGKLYLDTSNISNKTELKEAVTAKKEEIKKAYEEMLLEAVPANSDGSPKVLTPENIKKKENFNKFIDEKVNASTKTLSLLKQKTKNKIAETKESFKQTIRGDFDERYPRQLKSQEDLDNMIFLRHFGEWRARKRGYINPQDGLSSSQERRVNSTLDNLLKEVIANDKKKPEGERQFGDIYNQEQQQETPKVEVNTNTTTQQQETPKVEGSTTATIEQPATTKAEENTNVTPKEQKTQKENKLSKLFNDSFKKLQSIAKKINSKADTNTETPEPKVNSKPSDWGGSQKEFDNYVQNILSKLNVEDKKNRINAIIAHFNKRKDKETNPNIKNILDNLTKLQKKEEVDIKSLAYEIANATSQNIAGKVNNKTMKWSNARMFYGGGSIIGEDKTKDKKERNVDLTALAQIPEMLLALNVNRKNREGLNVKAPKIDKVEYYTPVFDNFALTQYYQKQADNIMKQAELQASQYSDPSIRERIMSSAQKQVQQLSDKAAMENVSTINKTKSEQINNAAKLAMQNNETDYKNKQIDYKNKLQEEQLKAAERLKNYESAITGWRELKQNNFLTKQQSDKLKMANKQLELNLLYQKEYKDIVAKYSKAGEDVLKLFNKQFPNSDINGAEGNNKMYVGSNITYKQKYDDVVNSAKQQMELELQDLKLRYGILNNNNSILPTNPNQYTIDVRAKGGSLSFNEKMQLERQKRIHNQIKHNLEIAKENEKRLRNQIDPAVNSLNKERLLVLNSILKG